jgi:hypothetical protein
MAKKEPKEWHVDRAKHIREMTKEERQRAKEREKANQDDWDDWHEGDID